METSIPDIFAAGDVAEAFDLVYGNHRVNAIWPSATSQGTIAGANMTGYRKKYVGSLAMNSLNLFGLTMISAGITKVSASPNLKQVSNLQTEERVKHLPDGSLHYRYLVWEQDVLKGYVLIGDHQKAGALTARIKLQQKVKEMVRKVL